MSPIRKVIGTAGVALGLFGVFRLLTQIPVDDLQVLAYWLIGALLLHDGLLSPIVVTVGAVLNRLVPPRARRYLQAALIAGGLITVIAYPMIYRQGSQPAVKAILDQQFGRNLATLLAIVAGVAVLLYAAQVVRDRQPATAASATNDRPPEHQDSPAE